MSDKAIALVTGGAGFIGSHMVDLLLDEGYRVRVIDDLSGGREANLAHHSSNPELEVEWGDIREIAARAAIYRGVELVFHFAGIGDIVPSIERPSDYMSVNVQGTVQALEGARAARAGKFIYAASSSCYGLAETPTREDHPIRPEYPYALSKYLGEQACLHWGQVYGLPVNSIRIFNAYGTRSRTSGAYGAVFGVFLRQKLANHPFTVVGDGSQSRDFVYASDVARAFLAAARSGGSGEIYNLGAGQPQTIMRLVELLGGDVVYLPERPGEPVSTHADISKISRELDWKPLISFEEGVAKILKEIDYWENAPLWTPEKIAEATADWFDMLSARGNTQ